MHRWCVASSEFIVDPGNFSEARVTTLSGNAFDEEEAFLRELASMVMTTYEGQQVGDFELLSEEALDPPGRTQWFYRRLFDGQGMPTMEFQTWASETLAAWIELRLDGAIGVLQNEPHHNDPAYDVISSRRNGQNVVTICIVQTKATDGNLVANCNSALDKFKKLEEGFYDAELNSKLTLMSRTGQLPPDCVPRDLCFDLDRRTYRVTAIHGEDRDILHLMTTYIQKVKGHPARRSARLVHVTNWTTFWEKLGRIVYAQLT